MYAKLALRNIKRGYQDYLIYFLTLVISVTLFYAFNSLADQPAFSNEEGNMEMVIGMIRALSLVMTILLSGLIVYANRFLIKKRKNELGIYMTLGMEQNKIATMFCIETIIIGVIALAVGIFTGVFVSQGFSMVIGNIFEMDMKQLEFVFSMSTAMITVAIFFITFLVVAVFNKKLISKVTLIELLYGEKKNEKVSFKDSKSSIVIFFASIILTGIGYVLVVKKGLLGAGSLEFIVGMLLMVVCTFTIYFTISALFIGVISKNKKVYYKGVNMFALRQISSKINTNIVLLATISLLLTITLTSFSMGFGINKWAKTAARSAAPFDVMISVYQESGEEHTDIIYDMLDKKGYDLVGKGLLESRTSDLSTMSLVNDDVLQEIKKYDNAIYNNWHKDNEYTLMSVISLSNLNSALEAKGDKKVSLEKDEYILSSNLSKESIQAIIKGGEAIDVAGNKLKPSEVILDFQLPDLNHFNVIIVNDEIAESFEVVGKRYVSNLTKELSVADNGELYSYFYAQHEKEFESESDELLKFAVDTLKQAEDSNFSMAAIMVFVGLYSGIVFLIASATILALQLLVDAADHRRRFEVLKKIGTEERMLNKMIFKQVAVYFFLPLVLAICHSVVTTILVNDWLLHMGTVSIYSTAVISGIIFVLIYGIYFVATYKTYKTTVLVK
ncbi:MAG: ABC transporter permease [Clostridium sp.]